MATYAIEQFELYVQGYLVEAVSEADASPVSFVVRANRS